VGGFTLMELLIVLAIMGLILTLAVSGIARTMPGFALRNDARLVADALRAARTAAVGGNREVALALDLEQRTVTFDNRRPVRLAPDLGITLTIGTSEIAGPQTGGISFFPDGSSTGGRVSLTLGERRHHVLVDWLTGTVSIIE
jgi:general secretion pathway protein H